MTVRAARHIPDVEPGSALDRLLRRVVAGPGGCWVWTGSQTSGYGTIKVDGRVEYVHRLSHELLVGPIPDGYEVDHVRERGCRSRLCANPAHLEAVPGEENNRRGNDALRTGRCSQGHQYADETTYRRPDGRRGCKPCRAERTREWRARRAA